LAQNVVDFDNIRKGFGDNLLIDELTFKLPPGGIVGVIGPNGAGKTTLFRMITKQETPDQGTIKTGESVHLGYVDQSRDTLDGKNSVWEEISGGLDMLQLGKREVNSRAYCSAFNFKGADQQKKVGQLSGGERNRVHLAKMLKSGANVILLDEPTNDLDVDPWRSPRSRCRAACVRQAGRAHLARRCGGAIRAAVRWKYPGGSASRRPRRLAEVGETRGPIDDVRSRTWSPPCWCWPLAEIKEWFQ